MSEDTTTTVTMSQVLAEMSAGIRGVADRLERISEQLKQTQMTVELLNQRLLTLEKTAHPTPCQTACAHTQELKELRAELNRHLAEKRDEIAERKAWRKDIWNKVIGLIIAAVVGGAISAVWAGLKLSIHQ